MEHLGLNRSDHNFDIIFCADQEPELNKIPEVAQSAAAPSSHFQERKPESEHLGPWHCNIGDHHDHDSLSPFLLCLRHYLCQLFQRPVLRLY